MTGLGQLTAKDAKVRQGPSVSFSFAFLGALGDRIVLACALPEIPSQASPAATPQREIQHQTTHG